MTRLRPLFLIVAAFCWVAGGRVEADEKVEVGLGVFEFTPDPTKPQQTLKVWTCRPKGLTPSSPIVFVMHGVKRNGRVSRDTWAPYSQRDNFLLIVPEFPEERYPSYAYQQGNILDRTGRPIDQGQWTFTVIEKLFDRVKTLTGNKSERYYLYGHSAGGQFVHRFVLFMPDARYERAIAANPGFYTFPTQDTAYPYGLKGTHVTGAIESRVFQRNFMLMLGAQDTDRDDPNLRKTPEADAQGLTRLERGRNFYQKAKSIAQQEKAKFNWKLLIVPGVGHSNQKMSQFASQALFSK